MPAPAATRVASVLRRLVPLLTAGLVLAACGGSDEPAAVDTSAATSTTSAATSGEAPATTTVTDSGSAVVPADAPAALQFAAPLVGGGDIELTTLAGRPVLLWFWAPW